MLADTTGPRSRDDEEPRRALGRRSIVAMLASAVGLIAMRPLARAGTALDSGSPVAISPARVGFYRGMNWDAKVRGIAENFRMPAGGWPENYDYLLGVPHGPVAEVTLQYSVPQGYMPSGWYPPGYTGYVCPTVIRVVVIDETVSDYEPPDTDLLISSPLQDMGVIAEAFLRLLDRDGLIVVDLSDLEVVSGAHLEANDMRTARIPRRARGVALDGVASHGSLVPAARDALDRLGEAGFDGGLCVVALVSEGDVPSFAMDGFDAFVAGVTEGQGERAIRRAIIHEASRSTVVLVAFEGSDS